MKLVSTFNAVHLDADPLIAVDGELYFNTASNSYRFYTSGSWTNIATTLDTSQTKIINKIGSPEIESVNLTLDENFINSIILINSASTSNIFIENDEKFNAPVGSYVEIVKGQSYGTVDIISGDGVTVNLPSTIYLTSPWQSGTLVKVEENVWILQAEFRDLY